MNQNIIKKKLDNQNMARFIAKVYRINKGAYSQNSYFATIKKEEVEILNIAEKDAILAGIQEKIFPAVVRKLNTSKNRFMLGFTIPNKIANGLPLKTNINLKFIMKAAKNKDLAQAFGKINLLRVIPQETIRALPVYIFDIGDNIIVWICSKGNKLFFLPKNIPINNGKYSLFEFGGAFFCEGFKARKINRHIDRLSFSNADREQIEWFLNAAKELLNIQKSEWKAQILFPNLEENKNLIKFWSKLGLHESHIEIYRNKSVKSLHGVCILNIYNSTLAEVVYHLMQHLIKKSLQSKENALNFFRGLSRGDLGVSPKGNSIEFSTENKENVLFFRELCKILEIPIQGIYNDKRGVKGYWKANMAVSHETFVKLIKLDAIHHSQRKYSLYNITMNHKKLVLYLYLKAISCGSNTSKSSARILNLSEITTRFYLKEFTEFGYLIRSSEGRHYIYSLADKGMQALKFYNQIENQIIKQKV